MSGQDPRPVVAFLFGGRSPEHSVSCVTAAGVIGALDDTRFRALPIGITRDGVWRLVDDWAAFSFDPESMPEVVDDGTEILPPVDARGTGLRRLLPDGTVEDLGRVDVYFPLLHGAFGEDGTVQGLFELTDAPFVGGSVLSSSVGMDKHFSKVVLDQAGIPTCPWETVTTGDWEREASAVSVRIRALGTTVFVKPARAGSSMGVSKVSDSADQGALASALTAAFEVDSKVIVEPAVVGREVECGVLGRQDSADVRASLPGEIAVSADRDFYDFETKYLDGDAVTLTCPADIDEATTERIQEIAVRTFAAFDCDGLARVDTFVTPDGDVLVNEINTMPGFTPSSMYPVMWERTGVSYPELVTALIDIALAKR